MGQSKLIIIMPPFLIDTDLRQKLGPTTGRVSQMTLWTLQILRRKRGRILASSRFWIIDMRMILYMICYRMYDSNLQLVLYLLVDRCMAGLCTIMVHGLLSQRQNGRSIYENCQERQHSSILSPKFFVNSRGRYFYIVRKVSGRSNNLTTC